MQEDLKQVVFELANQMMKLSGKYQSDEENKALILKNIENGLAYNKFKEMVSNQGGDVSLLDNVELFKKAEFIQELKAEDDGYINEINAQRVGEIARSLGAGKINKSDSIDYTVGIMIKVKVGDYIKKGDVLAEIHSNDFEKLEEAKKELKDVIKISGEPINGISTILEIIA